MAIKIQSIKSFSGFGGGNRAGEYYFSEGFHRSIFGIKPEWEIRNATDSSGLAALGIQGWFSQMRVGADNFIYSVNRTTEAADGRIFRVALGGDSFSLQHTPTTVSFGNGLITDQRGRLLYLQTRFLGMFDGSVWTDNWRDFGGDISPTHEWRPTDLFEDWVVMGNGNKVALLNTRDDSFNVNALDLPLGFTIRCIRSNRTGVLIGANFGNRGVLVLWDCRSARAIAPWIWLDENVRAIVPWGGNWVVVAGTKIMATNGYTTEDLSSLPDTRTNDFWWDTLYPSGVWVRNGYLFIGVSGGANFNRQRKGLFILNLKTRLWEYCVVSNRCSANLQMGGIIMSGGNCYLSFSTSRPARQYVGRLFNVFTGLATTSNKAIYISPVLGVGETQKTAEGFQMNINFEPSIVSAFTIPDPILKITVKIANFRRQLFRAISTNAVSGALNQLRVEGLSRSAKAGQIEIGDEVIILEGLNAGEVRHIVGIANRGAINETWTLDSNLPNLTESGISLETTTFRIIGTHLLDTYEIFKDLYFNIKNKPQGKKFLIKVVAEVEGEGGGRAGLEITGMSFIYDDLLMY